MLGLSDGNGIVPVKASESPVALKNDWPWVAICWKIDSALLVPPPHEQLICLHRLSLTIRFSRGKKLLVVLGAS